MQIEAIDDEDIMPVATNVTAPFADWMSAKVLRMDALLNEEIPLLWTPHNILIDDGSVEMCMFAFTKIC